MAYNKKEILKQAPPSIELEGGEFDLFQLSRPELDKVPFDKMKLICCVQGCNRGGTVRDYGISPVYFVVNAEGGPWHDLSAKVFHCGKHSRLHRQMQKQGKYFVPEEGYRPGPAIDHLISK